MGKNLLIEVGLEEIPARFLNDIIEDFKNNFKNFLDKENILYKNIEHYATPRRLVIFVTDISPYQQNRVVKTKGPKRAIAFSTNGEPTSALLGFMEKNGGKLEELKFEKVGKDEYVFIEKNVEGKMSKEIIEKGFNDVLFSIPIKKPMRWDNITFIRPIRWILALIDDEVLKIKIGNVESKNRTHPFLKSGKDYIKVSDANSYFDIMIGEGIIISIEKRKEKIIEELNSFVKELGVEIDIDEDLLDELTNLTESPKVFSLPLPSQGKNLPKEILLEILKRGARVFPGLKNDEIVYVFGVQNGINRKSEIVKEGFFNIIKAKIDDAIFFYNKDKEINLKDRIDSLKKIVFEKNLGTYYDKTLRIIKLLSKIYSDIKINEEERIVLDRAALLSYTDLTTLTVQEYPELHGIIGKILSSISKEERAVGDIIGEFIYPRKRSDKLPNNYLSKILGIADRVDTLVGSFISNLEPTSKEDPVGLRRISFTLLELLISFENRLSLKNLIEYSLNTYPDDLKKDFNVDNLINFIKGRFKLILEENGVQYDIINCILNLSDIIPYYSYKNAKYIKEIYNESNFIEFVKAYKRIFNIVKDYKEVSEIRKDLFIKDEEKELYDDYLSIKDYIEKNKILDFSIFFNKSTDLVNKINKFFDNVLVMDKDEDIKNNRLNLIKNILILMKNFGSFDEIIKS